MSEEKISRLLKEGLTKRKRDQRKEPAGFVPGIDHKVEGGTGDYPRKSRHALKKITTH